MALELTYLGHSGFLLGDGAHTLALDPFLTGNPLAKHKPKDVRCQSVAVTHGHEDHVGDAVEIARANRATVYANHEISLFFEEQGCTASGGNPGGKVATPFGWIAFTHAFHSSSHGGRYMGNPCGLVVRMGGVTLYHAGDTGLFTDLKMYGEIYRPDIACLPVGDRYTMGGELASKAAEWIAPKVAIPIHFATFPVLAKDASAFRPKGVEVKVMAPGERWSFG